MKRLTLNEKMKDCQSRGEVLPLKGDLRLILEDIRDGSQKITEVHNLPTSALQSILAHNACGLANFSQLFPLRKLMGGVFCFQNAQTESADAYNPPSDLDNPLIAHAGDLANNTGSVLRGSPVTNDFVITDTAIKQVWLWDNTQGNGHIESVSLVPATLGNMGLKPFDDEFSPLSVFGSDAGDGASTYTEDEAKQYPFNIDSSGKFSTTIYMDGATFKEITVRHDFYKYGIMRGPRDWQVITSRTATIRENPNRIIFDDANFYYIASAYFDSQTNKYGLYIDKVSKSTFAVTQNDLQYETVTLYTGTIYDDTKGAQRLFGFDGTYLYFPNSAGNGFCKLNISDSSDKAVISGAIDIGMGRSPSGSDGRQYTSPLAISEGLIIGSNYIINGANAYPIKHARQIACGSGNYGMSNRIILNREGASVYGVTRYVYNNIYRVNQANILLEMFLSTIANLPEARDKSTSQTMRVEYTTTEAT